MVDITLCANYCCPLRDACTRFSIDGAEYQSHACFDFRSGGEEIACDSYRPESDDVDPKQTDSYRRYLSQLEIQRQTATSWHDRWT